MKERILDVISLWERNLTTSSVRAKKEENTSKPDGTSCSLDHPCPLERTSKSSNERWPCEGAEKQALKLVRRRNGPAVIWEFDIDIGASSKCGQTALILARDIS